MTWGQLVAGVTSAVLVLIGTWVSSKFSARVGHQANEVTSQANHTDSWDRLLKRNEQWQATQQARIDRLESEVRDLREWRHDMEPKYRAAMAYIRRLVRQLQRHVEPDDIETPPPEIHPDL